MIAKSKLIQDNRGLLSVELANIELKAPEFVYLALENARCPKAEALVKAGDRVLLGQKIGVRHGPFFDQNIHATVSGTVVGLEKHGYRNGKVVNTIKIQNDFKDEKDPSIVERSDEEVAKLSREEIAEIVKDKSMVGLGGSSFPTYIKFQTKDPINTILINGVECEPYLNADQRLMEGEVDKLIKGMHLLQQAFGTKDCRICVKEKHAELIEELKVAFEEDGGDLVVAPMQNFYPQGWEVAMIETATGIRLAPGELPAKKGIIDFNAASVVGIYDAVKYNMPVYERYLSVQGDGIVTPANCKLRIGTLLSEVIAQCGGYKGDDKKVLILGGPMMGSAIPTDDTILSKTITSILVLNEHPVEEHPCVRCGSCVLSCPTGLEPVNIMNAVKAVNKEAIKALQPLRCIECGLCTYSCTSGIRVTDYVRRAKIIAKL
jgi:electron transport complex protein RnfC